MMTCLRNRLWTRTLIPAKQQRDLDKLERELVDRCLGTVSNLAREPGKINNGRWGAALGEDAPFLSYCVILRQERIARFVKHLTWVLVFLTAVLAVLTAVLIWRPPVAGGAP